MLQTHPLFELRCPINPEPALISAVERRKLLPQQALQDAVFGSGSFLIIATDAQGIIQLFNTGAENMLGFSSAEVVGRFSPSDLHDPDEMEARAKSLTGEIGAPVSAGFGAMAFKASCGIEDIYELTFICKNKQRLPAIVSITALRDDYSSVIGYLLIGADNSQRKREAEELKKAKLAAEVANQAKSDFLSAMSHELRTPLSAILGFAQLIESGTPAPTLGQQRSLDQILQGGWYLLELINEILDLALIESGQMSLSLENVAMPAVLQECQSMIEAQAHGRGIRLDFSPTMPGLSIRADRTRVKQVLLNLLSNAVKYNQFGGSITVRTQQVGEGSVRTSVEDTGVGLSEQQIAQLFQPFNRLGQELYHEQGTGIGLVMTKRLVELMGGTIGVNSSPNAGSTFWFDMQASPADTACPADANGIALVAAECTHSTAPLSMLYIEDNPANLLLVEQLVARRCDICLHSAADGEHGVAMARTLLPDVILMDINLPGISGAKALQILRNDPLTAHIPIMALSANAVPRDIARGLEAGFYRYLTKPIKVLEFMAALDAAFAYAKSPPMKAPHAEHSA